VLRTAIVLVWASLLVLLATHGAKADPVQWADNGHWYEALVTSTSTWEEARDAAESTMWMGAPGHLATGISQEEMDFVAGLLSEGAVYWLGGYQAPPSALPGEGWQWVTAEAWSYTNWRLGEPNDYYGPGTESCLEVSTGGWSDARCTEAKYLVIEYDIDTPAARATWGTVKALYRSSGG
jgi:Lectin C-type domain